MATDPRLIDLFLEVARIEGTSGHERAVADYVRRVLEALGMHVREDDAHAAAGGDCGNLVARAGHGGLSRALVPVHTTVDGDGLVAAATGRGPAAVDLVGWLATLAVEQAVRTVALPGTGAAR